MARDGKKVILLVEDETITATIEKKSLENYNYKVVTVATGEEAFRKAVETDEIDLILMDIELGGGLDGTETAQKILENRDIPIVFLSSHTEPEVVAKTEKITSYGYVVKNSGITVIDASLKMAFKLYESRKQVEEQKQRLATTLNSIGDAVISTDTMGKIVQINPVARSLTGWMNEDLVGKPLEEVYRIVNANTHQPAQNPVERVLRHGRIIGVANHTILIARDGQEYQIADSAAPIYDPDGTITGVVLVFRNVTEDYRVHRELKQTVEQNKLLLRELQHRAKNSFSMITSMIALMGDSTRVPEISNILDELETRVLAVSELYDLLYASGTMEAVAFDEYIAQISASLPDVPHNVSVHTDIDAIQIPVMTALPLGIIISELITNSIKHAFPGNASGSIAILMYREENDFLLSVSDSGKGLPMEFDPEDLESMGLLLIYELVRQIKGVFTITNRRDQSSGTIAQIRFPAPEDSTPHRAVH